MSELKEIGIRWEENGELHFSHVYLKSEADKVIAEKDAEIAELKKKLMPCLNGDCILTCEVVEKYGKENAELKADLAEKDKEIAELKARIQLDEEVK